MRDRAVLHMFCRDAYVLYNLLIIFFPLLTDLWRRSWIQNYGLWQRSLQLGSSFPSNFVREVILTIYALSIEMSSIRCVPYVRAEWQLGCLRKCCDEQLTNQRQLIVSQFGFTPIQTTLLGCVDGVVESAYLVPPLSSPFRVRAPRIPVVSIYTNSGGPVHRMYSLLTVPH